tara:strand:- start:29833 stop:31146 length:1314 start_codon:yes stop_codon:yes gene_type:complete
MAAKKKRPKNIYWARPITTYSVTHKNALEAHESGVRILTPEKVQMHTALYEKYKVCEEEVHAFLEGRGYVVVDPGSQKVADAFEAWQREPLSQVNTKFDEKVADQYIFYRQLEKAISEYKDRLASPMPFFTKLCDSCQEIAFMPFRDALTAYGVINSINRIGCGMEKEIDSMSNRRKPADVMMLHYDEGDTGPKIKMSQPFDWNAAKFDSGVVTCLDYPSTKALLVLDGYVSRSSKHKSGPQTLFWTRSLPFKSYYWRTVLQNSDIVKLPLDRQTVVDFIEDCQESELKTHAYLTKKGYSVVDAGQPASMDAFELWRGRSVHNKKCPTLFYEVMAQSCQHIAVTPFVTFSDDEFDLNSADIFVTCGIVKEVDSFAVSSTAGDVFLLLPENDMPVLKKTDWQNQTFDGKPFSFLNRDETLGVLEKFGYTSRSQKYKDK